MSGKLFLDTNVFVYLVDARDSTKSLMAHEVLRSVLATDSGVISYQVEQEFFHVAFRRFAQTMTTQEAEDMHAWLFGRMQCVASSHATLTQALRLKERYRLPWYDSLIVSAALNARCSVLFSEDFQPGQVFESTLTVINPFAA